MQPQALRLTREPGERVAQLRQPGGPGELHPHRRHVPVHDVHPVALRAHRERRRRDAITVQPPQDLEGLPLDFLLFVRDVGDHVTEDIE